MDLHTLLAAQSAFGILAGGIISQGLVYGLMALGVYITFKILDFPDLTVDGSFVLGAAVYAKLAIEKQANGYAVLIVALVCGFLAGSITGILNTKFRIPGILASILTMLGLWSINLAVMGRANIGISREESLVGGFFKNATFKNHTELPIIIVSIIVILLMITLLYWFFGTEYGSAIRATGKSEDMIKAQGVNVDRTKIIAIGISNALVALSGALAANQQGFADITMGTGTIIMGLAAIVIAEVIFSRVGNFFFVMCGVIVGMIIYWLIINLILLTSVNTKYLKLIQAILVVAILGGKYMFSGRELPGWVKNINILKKKDKNKEENIK